MSKNLQKIGALSSIGLVIGSIVGTGIFVTPIMVAKFSTSLSVTLVLWALGGFMCAIGGEIYGRFGQRFPFGGGQYIYLEKSLGKDIALVYGWMSLLIISPSMISGYSMFFGEQARNLFPSINQNGIQIAALIFLSLITAINYFGIRAAGSFEKIVVSLQIFLILGLFFVLAFKSDSAPVPSTLSLKGFSAGAAAIVGILWSYEGFNCLSFVAHEIKDSSKNLTKYVMAGCAVVMILYFLLNYLALNHIPFQVLIDSPNIAVPLATKAFGGLGALVTLTIMVIAVFMSAVPAVMIGPRVTQQMAIEGWLPSRLGSLHPKYTSPAVAIFLQFILSAIFLFIGNFEWLITCFITISWCFYILVALGFLLSEKKESKKISLSDLLKTSVFMALASVVIVIQAIENPILSLWGAGILVASYLIARFLRR